MSDQEKAYRQGFEDGLVRSPKRTTPTTKAGQALLREIAYDLREQGEGTLDERTAAFARYREGILAIEAGAIEGPPLSERESADGPHMARPNGICTLCGNGVIHIDSWRAAPALPDGLREALDAQFDAVDKSLLVTFQWSNKEYERNGLAAHVLIKQLAEIGWTVVPRTATASPDTGGLTPREAGAALYAMLDRWTHLDQRTTLGQLMAETNAALTAYEAALTAIRDTEEEDPDTETQRLRAERAEARLAQLADLVNEVAAARDTAPKPPLDPRIAEARPLNLAALTVQHTEEAMKARCWFCERPVGIDHLIAGYDTFEEQRLACFDCDRTMKALHSRGFSLPDGLREALAAVAAALDAAEAWALAIQHTKEEE